MRKLFKYLVLSVLALTLISCEDNDNNTQQPNVDSNL